MFPPIEPFAAGHLQVAGRNELYRERSGNPGGKPALYRLVFPREWDVFEAASHGGDAMVQDVIRAIARFAPGA